MIQDAHPLRSGIPDGYSAFYKIDVTVAASTWTVDKARFPSGFGGGTAAGDNAFAGTGVGVISWPAGLKVRGSKVAVDSRGATGTQVLGWVTNINETTGTANIVFTSTAAPATLANPPVNSVIYIELDLETV